MQHTVCDAPTSASALMSGGAMIWGGAVASGDAQQRSPRVIKACGTRLPSPLQSCTHSSSAHASASDLSNFSIIAL